MAKRGNPGYGKLENIRLNVDKFMPCVWQLMEEFSESPKAKATAVSLFRSSTRSRPRLIPQTLAGDPENPIEHKVTGINYILPDGNHIEAGVQTAPRVFGSE